MSKILKFTLHIGILLIFSILIYFVIEEIKELCLVSDSLKLYLDMMDRKNLDPYLTGITFEDLQKMIDECRSYMVTHSFLVSFTLLSIIACPLILAYCNPRLFRRSTWVNLSEEWAKNKQERAAARQAKAETDKQKRIEELQKELDELHGSDKSD